MPSQKKGKKQKNNTDSHQIWNIKVFSALNRAKSEYLKSQK